MFGQKARISKIEQDLATITTKLAMLQTQINSLRGYLNRAIASASGLPANESFMDIDNPQNIQKFQENQNK